MLSWPAESAAKLIRRLADALRRPGGVVLLPTETVYGLVARAADAEACRRIYQLKNRPGGKPLGWFLPQGCDPAAFGLCMTETAQDLFRRFTPGPLTIIVPARAGGTQGFRIPDHPLLSALLQEMGEPLAQTSANASGAADPLCCSEAIKQLSGKVDEAVDGGPLPPGSKGSTVVDATGEQGKILRVGAFSPAEIFS